MAFNAEEIVGTYVSQVQILSPRPLNSFDFFPANAVGSGSEITAGSSFLG